MDRVCSKASSQAAVRFRPACQRDAQGLLANAPEKPLALRRGCSNPLVEEIDNLKAQDGKNIITFGGAGFAAELINVNLVDEYQFHTNPIALHEGLSIFDKRGIDSDLQLLSAQAYECGIVVSKYAPRGRS